MPCSLGMTEEKITDSEKLFDTLFVVTTGGMVCLRVQCHGLTD